MRERLQSIFYIKNRTAATFVVAVIAGVTIGFLVGAPLAQANLFQDFFNNFLGPLLPVTSTSTPSFASASSSVPLYQPAVDYEQAVVQAVKKASPSVVAIVVSKDIPVLENCPFSPFSDLPPEFQQFFGNTPQLSQPCKSGKTELQEVGGGSGFIISADGLILTNRHVVSDESASYAVFTNDGKKHDAKVLARDPVQDLAVVKIEASGLPAVLIGDSDALELGQTAIAIGNALAEFRNTVSVGVISGLARTVTASSPGVGAETIQGVIQTDAAINPGNSGGPLLNLRGEVIGINTAIASNAQNIGFAIPINRAKHDIDSVKTSGKIHTPFLGVRYTVVTADLVAQKKLSVDYGALVMGTKSAPAVSPNSPAAQADVRDGDVITEVNGKKIDSDHTLVDVINGFSVGQTVALTVRRGTDTLTLKVTLAERPQ